MDKTPCDGNGNGKSQDVEVRKGPWTMEEDLILINYIANHGEGVWNSLAKAAGKLELDVLLLLIRSIWLHFMHLLSRSTVS